jgi:hypothetical protein
MSDQEMYYGTMNWLTAPIRWVRSIIQTALYTLIAIIVGLMYPVIVYFNHEPVTFATFAVPLLVLLALFTLFYATYYLIFGGMAFLVAWAAWIIIFDAPDRDQALWIWFAFLSVGVMQSYIRRRIAKASEPEKKQFTFVQQLNQVRLERLTRQYDTMDKGVRATMVRLYGNDYFTWPEPWPHTSDSASGQMRP